MGRVSRVRERLLRHASVLPPQVATAASGSGCLPYPLPSRFSSLFLLSLFHTCTTMYSSRQTHGSPPPELSNNPFIDHPSNAMARFPDITGSDAPSSSQYTSWLNKPSTSTLNTNMSGYYGSSGPMPSPHGYNGSYQQQPQATGWGQGSGFSQPQLQQQSYGQSFSPPPTQSQGSGMPFQPSSSFGQQLAAQVQGAYPGMPQQQQQQQQQYSSYPQQVQSPQYGQGYPQGFPGQQQQPQQQLQQRPSYLTEFDPYAGGSQSGTAPTPGIQNTGVGTGSGFRAQGQQQQQHPREYVQAHKAELESWDSYSWKQVRAVTLFLSSYRRD